MHWVMLETVAAILKFSFTYVQRVVCRVAGAALENQQSGREMVEAKHGDLVRLRDVNPELMDLT
jgi:hypothetical protein